MKRFQNNFFYDVFMIFLRFPFMFFLWVQIVVMFFFMVLGTIGKSLRFFWVLDMIFFMALDMFFFDLDMFFFTIFLWVWKWFWPKS